MLKPQKVCDVNSTNFIPMMLIAYFEKLDSQFQIHIIKLFAYDAH